MCPKGVRHRRTFRHPPRSRRNPRARCLTPCRDCRHAKNVPQGCQTPAHFSPPAQIPEEPTDKVSDTLQRLPSYQGCAPRVSDTGGTHPTRPSARQARARCLTPYRDCRHARDVPQGCQTLAHYGSRPPTHLPHSCRPGVDKVSDTLQRLPSCQGCAPRVSDTGSSGVRPPPQARSVIPGRKTPRKRPEAARAANRARAPRNASKPRKPRQEP